MARHLPVPQQFQAIPCLGYEQLFKRCLDEARKDGLYLEFGVGKGYSLRVLRNLIPNDVTLYGFDSFKGLPEAWNESPVGAFAADPKNIQLPNVTLVAGMFDDTLPGFAAQHKQPISFANIDCDLYGSTRTILRAMRDNIVSGTVLHFDEYFGYPGWEQHEYKAFQEFLAETKRSFIYLGRGDCFHMGVKIT